MDMVVSAVFTLQDMLSGGLDRIRSLISKTGEHVASLTGKMGSLVMAMAPLALLSASLAIAFGGATSKAIAFESSMADVGKVIDFDTQAEFEAMGQTILEMSGKIPMAAEGLAAIVAAAGQTGVAKEDLTQFAEQAAKMGVAFDLTGDMAGQMMADWRAGMKLTLPEVYALADAVNHLTNNMNATAPALGEVMQRAGALGMAAGLAETQVAALGSALLSSGSSPQIVATAMRNMLSTLVQGEAMTKRSADAFKSLGFSAVEMAKTMQTDAQGTIFSVLNAIAQKPKELQLSLLSEMFGESALAAIAPLLGNMENLSMAFDLVGDSTAYAGSMQAEYDTRSKTTENSLLLLSNRWKALSITIGNVFLPYVNSAVSAISDVIDWVRSLLATPAGQWFIKIAGGIAMAVLAFVAFGAALVGLNVVLPLIASGFTAISTAVFALGAPFFIVIGLVSALYLAYKNNFGGMADTINRWANNISLVFKGVSAVFSSLSGGVGEIKGELAEDIEAAGLLGVVTFLSKIINRFSWLWKGAWYSIQESMYSVREKLGAIFGRLGDAFERLGAVFQRIMPNLFGSEVDSSVSSWFSAGEMIGSVFNWLVDVVVFAISGVVSGIELAVTFVELLCALFTGDFTAAGELVSNMLDIIGSHFSGLLDLLPFGLGDKIREIFNDVWEFLSNFSLLELGKSIIDSLWNGIFGFGTDIKAKVTETVTDGLSGILDIDLFESGKALIGTFADGIVSMKDSLVEKVSGVFSKVKNFFPHSDAPEGPFSNITASGMALITTFSEGAGSVGGNLLNTVSGIFSSVQDAFTSNPLELIPALAEAFMPENGEAQEAAPGQNAPENYRGQTVGETSGKSIIIHGDLHVSLPNATDGQSFFDELKTFVEQFASDDV